jgi:lysophospholipase L1-like esterase
MAGALILPKQSSADLDDAPAGKVRLAIDDAGLLVLKDEDGALTPVGADLGPVEDALAAKADTTTVTTALASKADSAATATALAGKQAADADLTAVAAAGTGAAGLAVLASATQRTARTSSRAADARSLTSAAERAKAPKTAATPELTPTITVNGAATLTGTSYATVAAEAVNPAVPMEYRGSDMARTTTFITPKEQRREGLRKAKTGYPWQIAFDYFGQAFEFTLSGGGEQFSYRVWDGDRVSAYRTETSGKKTHKIDFGTRGWHRVVIDVDYGLNVEAVIGEKTGLIVRPRNRAALKVAAVGDSYVDGANCHTNESSTPPASCQSWTYTLMKLLGVTDFRMLGMPGTGYLNKAVSGENFVGNYRERIQDVIEAAPDVAIIQGSINDKAKGQNNKAELQGEIETYVAQLQAALPNALVILTTPVPVTTAQWEENAGNAEAIIAAAAAKGVSCIDARAQKIIYGTGKVGATDGSGTADYFHNQWDESHPSLEGHQAIARFIAGEVAAYLGLSTGTPEIVTAAAVDLSAIEASVATKAAATDSRFPKLASLAADLPLASNSVALQNLTGLGLEIGASVTEAWLVEWWLLVEAANATMDLELSFAALPAGATVKWGPIMGGSVGAVTGWMATGTGGTPQVIRSGASPISMATIAGTVGINLAAIVTGGGTAGTVQLQGAQDTSDAGALKILRGSAMRANKTAA